MFNIKWIDIKKQLPIHGQKALITDGKEVAAGEADLKFLDDGQIWWDGCGYGGDEWEWDFDIDQVTHWMPLPEPPNKEKEVK